MNEEEKQKLQRYNKIHSFAFTDNNDSVEIAKTQEVISFGTTKEPKATKGGIDISYFNNLTNLLRANNSSQIHARTLQRIDGTSGLDNKKQVFPRGKKHLCRNSFTAYHRNKNRTIRAKNRFAIINGEIVAQKFNNGEWNKTHPNNIQYKKTSQRKSVWFVKHQRRS